MGRNERLRTGGDNNENMERKNETGVRVCRRCGGAMCIGSLFLSVLLFWKTGVWAVLHVCTHFHHGLLCIVLALSQ